MFSAAEATAGMKSFTDFFGNPYRMLGKVAEGNWTSSEELLQPILCLCPYEIAIRADVLTAVELNLLVIRHLCSSGAPKHTRSFIPFSKL